MGVGTVVVLGATGFTGRLIAEELRRTDVPLLLCGRDPEKLNRLSAALGGAPTALVDVGVEGSVARVVQPGDVIVNCVGPFGRLGKLVLRETVEGGAHYLDTTGEQGFMLRAVEEWGERAVAAGVTIVNAMAFEYALGCCAAKVLAARAGGSLRAIEIVYGWQVGPGGASAGTRRSVLDVLGGPCFVYEGGRLVEERTGGRAREVIRDGVRRMAVRFPAGEVVTLPRHLEVERVIGWMIVGGGMARLLPLIAPVLPSMIRAVRPILDPVLGLGPEGPSAAIRAESRFRIDVEGERTDGSAMRLAVEGVDPYGLTAAIATRGALRMVGRTDAAGAVVVNSSPPPAPPGVIDAAQLMDPASFLDGLSDRGLRWALSE